MCVRMLLSVLLSALLAGCLAQGLENADPRTLSTYVQKKSSVYEPYTTYIGPSIQYGGSQYFFRSAVDNDTGQRTHQLYVYTSYRALGWEFWQWARNDKGQALDFEILERTVLTCAGEGCVYREQFGIDISDDYLRERAGTGGSVKVYAKTGHEAVITLPPNYIQAQLLAIDPCTVSPGFTPAAVESEPASE